MGRVKEKVKKQPIKIILRQRFIRYRNLLHSYKTSEIIIKLNWSKLGITVSNFGPLLTTFQVDQVVRTAFPVQEFLRPGDAAAPDTIKEIAQSFNDYFAGVGSQLARAIHPVGEAWWITLTTR